MSFWSSEKLIEKQKEVGLIEHFQKERVKHGAYELSLGSWSFITSDSNKKNIHIGEHIRIPPGQFGLLLVKENVDIPPDAIGFISIKASIKFLGLVNVSGFHVDPGFNGHLKFSVYNAGSKTILLAVGEPTFLIWFADLDQPTDIYNGNHAGKNEISPDDIMSIEGEVTSPAQLNSRIKDLEVSIGWLKVIIIAVLLTLLVTVLGNQLTDVFSIEPNKGTSSASDAKHPNSISTDSTNNSPAALKE